MRRKQENNGIFSNEIFTANSDFGWSRMFHVYSFLTKLGQILFTWIIAEVG
ncbi:carbamoyltransferase HypF [Bacillus altitudinis]|nr:carbamoyltransferase HypF [Bacillus pumilus]